MNLSYLVTSSLQREKPEKKIKRLTIQKRIYDVTLVLEGLGIVEVENKSIKMINFQPPVQN